MFRTSDCVDEPSHWKQVSIEEVYLCSSVGVRVFVMIEFVLNSRFACSNTTRTPVREETKVSQIRDVEHV